MSPSPATQVQQLLLPKARLYLAIARLATARQNLHDRFSLVKKKGMAGEK